MKAMRMSLMVTLAMTLPADVSAQAPVHSSERVRVSADRRWTGTVQYASADSLILLADGADKPLALAVGSIDRLEVFAGRKSRTKGFLVGGSIGGAIGLLLGLVVRSGVDECVDSTTPDEVGIFDPFLDASCTATGLGAMVYGPVLGGLFGGGIGAVINGGEKWRAVHIPSSFANIQVRPTFSNGIGFAASIPAGAVP